jgi:hypothetical protein
VVVSGGNGAFFSVEPSVGGTKGVAGIERLTNGHNTLIFSGLSVRFAFEFRSRKKTLKSALLEDEMPGVAQQVPDSNEACSSLVGNTPTRQSKQRKPTEGLPLAERRRLEGSVTHP